MLHFSEKKGGMACLGLTGDQGARYRGVALWRLKWRNGGKNRGIHGGIGLFGWRKWRGGINHPDGGIPRGQGSGCVGVNGKYTSIGTSQKQRLLD